MRSLMILILLVGAVALFMTTTTRVRHVEANAFRDDARVIETMIPAPEFRPELRMASNPRATVVVQKPTVKRMKRSPAKDSVYTFSVIGTSDTAESAKKDALYQAARFVASSLELRKTMPEEARLEKMVADAREKSEGFLGTSDGKDLGEGKQVELTFELPTDYISQLTQIERNIRMDDRMGWLARGLAVIVAALFAISGYMRLDEWSKGYFSGVLKLIALVAVVGTGFAVYMCR